jgi:N-acetylneuraminate synthase
MNFENTFKNLFVLELANNHLGSLQRGIKIINDHAKIVRYNNVKAAIKLQFRDVTNFIHPNFKKNQEIRYIKKTESTQLSINDLSILVQEIKNKGCIPMATPFDETSVDLCIKFEMPIIKIASSDINDWSLLEKISSTRKPTIISTGGVSEKDLDDVVIFFEKRNIPLAINHCVSIYPSEDEDLNLDQIDYLKNRYPDHIIGLSSHEYKDWQSSMLISFAKGVRTWERHIDIDYEGVPVSKYCSKPANCDIWFKTFHKAKEMCGSFSDQRRVVTKKETEYLNQLVRGIYAKKDLETGYKFSSETFKKDFYLAVPLLKGQLSSREIVNGQKLIKNVKANQALTIEDVDGPYNENQDLKKIILDRGLEQ